MTENAMLAPYEAWFYGIERRHGSDATDVDRKNVLAFPFSHARQARAHSSSLAIHVLDDLLEIGASPILATIGIEKEHADYETARREWIAISIDSLIAGIDEAVKSWRILPGEPFQNALRLENDLFFVTVDTVDGLTVASPTASKARLYRLLDDINAIAGPRLTDAVALLREAT